MNEHGQVRFRHALKALLFEKLHVRSIVRKHQAWHPKVNASRQQASHLGLSIEAL